MTATSTHPVADKLNALARELNQSFLEREEVVESALLALLTGEHHYQLGMPGTAKSQIVRAIVGALTGATYFEAALSKNRPAEAIFGPLNIKKFREDGDYVLKRTGFATDVDICFLDEAGKMSPVIGHDLLPLMNERIYHEVNGSRSVHSAPLHTAFTASNEMITGESDDAAALWDRLLLRVYVAPLQEKANFAKLLTSNLSSPTTTLDFAELKNAAANDVPAITVPDQVVKSIVNLRMKLANEHMYPSDRRWRQSIKVLKAAAFLAGRTDVDDEDLAVLRYVLWDTEDQIDRVAELCHGAANPFVDTVANARAGLREIEEAMDSRISSDDTAKKEYGKEANQKLLAVRRQLDDLLAESGYADGTPGRPIPGFKEVSDLHLELTRRTFIEFLETPEDVIPTVLQSRTGKGDGGNK